jgi:uncharacterized alkaline shock family protein YloU/adenylate kinase family enzyme
MKVYGLVGSSGTGKSYRALGLAKEKGISYIVDDGLLIRGAKIIAGVSAKKEATKLAAIRRAIFMDPGHAESVKEAIRVANPDSILVLGTSVSMIDRIALNLGLPPVDTLIHIEDIASEREIRMAQRRRREDGKHIIPVPTFEIRKDFSGYFIDPLKIFRYRGKEKRLETLEKTVVRPTYSYLGRFYIADSAIESIAVYNAQSLEGICRVLDTSIVSRADGILVYIGVSVYYGYKIYEILEKMQYMISNDIVRVTGLNVIQVNAAAKRLVLSSQEETGSL